MKKSYSLGRYEIFVVAAVIAIIASVALDRYFSLAKDARDLGFEIISHHFMKGVADARVQWILQPDIIPITEKKYDIPVDIGSQHFYVSSQGWPASIKGPVGKNGKPHIDDCYQLWMSLLRNPAPISKEGVDEFGSRQYHVSVQGDACRYRLVTDDHNDEYFFEYFPFDGRVILSVPKARRYKN